MEPIPKYRSGTVKVTKGLVIELVGNESDTLASVQLDRIDAQRVAHALLEYCGAKALTGIRASQHDCGFELVFGIDRAAEKYKLRPAVKLTHLTPGRPR